MSECYPRKLCPQCGSSHVTTKDTARQWGGVIGAIGGAISGGCSAVEGARLGSVVGLIGGPPGVALGTIAGAVLGALLGAATGGVAGSQLGRAIDLYVLNNNHCQQCGFAFGLTPEGDTVPLYHTSDPF